jgi:metal-responsive CopG/Arc/MetJ family transcriptional regulator
MAKAIRLQITSNGLMSDYALPVSVSITQQQLAWLDARRRHGSLSRSAALRQVLDAAMDRELLLDRPDRASPNTAATSTASR